VRRWSTSPSTQSMEKEWFSYQEFAPLTCQNIQRKGRRGQLMREDISSTLCPKLEFRDQRWNSRLGTDFKSGKHPRIRGGSEKCQSMSHSLENVSSFGSGSAK
jgi:hypothetical protein